jgi:UDP-2,4-diacetamido-2,4,6-trideoxy-beta-L-altropyranose hydrolase
MNAAAPRILFLPDFGPQVGGGHAFRCFALAEALTARGAVCGVALDEAGAQALARFAPQGVAIVGRGDPVEVARRFEAHAMVVDDYDVDAAAEQPLMQAGLRLAVIDDLADRKHLCDLLVDPGFRRDETDYRHLVPPGAELLLGPDYALLRPEFAQARSAALNRRKGSFGHRALVSLGLTDVGGTTARVARLLAGLVPMDVVLGSAAPSLAAVRTLPGVTVHVDAANMAELIAQADIAVGAGGSSTWERACLGLPSISLTLADNQAAMARRLDEAGIVIALDPRDDGFDQRLVTAVERLFSDVELRCQLTHRAAHLCDGLGAGRVADALLAKLG